MNTARAARTLGAVVAAVLLTLLATATGVSPARADGTIATIERVKASVVAVGTYERTRTPPFQFRGTGFAVGDGTLIVTNAHVLPDAVDPAKRETIAVLLPALAKDKVEVREARRLSMDPGSDLAVIKVDGTALSPLKVGDSDRVREGQGVLFTGFPIGPVLGPYPATHRGMISAITPIAIPQGRSAELDAHVIRRLNSGAFPVFQLDATAYPGNSGSPVYDPETGDVVAIVNMVFVKGTKESVLTQPSGITYAVPSKHLADLLQKLR